MINSSQQKPAEGEKDLGDVRTLGTFVMMIVVIAVVIMVAAAPVLLLLLLFSFRRIRMRASLRMLRLSQCPTIG